MLVSRSKLDLLAHAGLAVVVLLGIQSTAHANSAFFSPDEDTTVTAPARQSKAAHKHLSRKARKAAQAEALRETEPPAPAQDEAVADDTGDRKPEAKTCYRCSRIKTKGEMPVEKILGGPRGYHSAQEACYSQAIFEAAQSNTRRRYRNRNHSGGLCATGVASHLHTAGVIDGLSLGDAIDYEARGKLEAVGFTNHISEYKTAAQAPKGAVLVYAGPKSSDYITHGVKLYSDGCRGYQKNGHWVLMKRGRRVNKCFGAGNWAGHVTIAGENRSKSSRWWYTDGRTPEAAVSRRRLIGVYLMDHCTGGCSQTLHNRCGG